MYKIGVCTLFNINNYGSILQTYALQESLKELNYTPYVIDANKTGSWGRIRRIIRMMKLGLEYYDILDYLEQP